MKKIVVTFNELFENERGDFVSSLRWLRPDIADELTREYDDDNLSNLVYKVLKEKDAIITFDLDKCISAEGVYITI